jgi:hypothetical protein
MSALSISQNGEQAQVQGTIGQMRRGGVSAAVVIGE